MILVTRSHPLWPDAADKHLDVRLCCRSHWNGRGGRGGRSRKWMSIWMWNRQIECEIKLNVKSSNWIWIIKLNVKSSNWMWNQLNVKSNWMWNQIEYEISQIQCEIIDCWILELNVKSSDFQIIKSSAGSVIECPMFHVTFKWQQLSLRNVIYSAELHMKLTVPCQFK